MGVSVTFSYPTWIATFPEFSNITSAQAQGFFNQAVIFHRNDGFGPIEDATSQLTYLNLLVAHFAQLLVGTSTNPASPLVGRISNATEGSVSLGIENKYPEGTAQWFQQSKYGSMYWTITAPYRQMRYIRGPQRNFNTGPAYIRVT